MNTAAAPYDLIGKLRAMKLGVLVEPVRSNSECFIQTTRGAFCVYRAGATLAVVEGPDGRPSLRIGHPMEGGLTLRRGEILRASSGVPQLPTQPGIIWERLVEHT